VSVQIEDDPLLGSFFDSAEKKARWLVRIKIAYYLWIAFMILGIIFFLIWYVFS
jgi:hypothetical protein